MPPAQPALPWSAISEIAFGALVQGEISPKVVKPEAFQEPYSRAVKLLKDRPKTPTEKLMEIVGLNAYQAAIRASKAMKDLPANWLVLLDSAANHHQIGLEMERMSQKLKNGESVDWGKVRRAMERYETGLPQVQQMSKVKAAGEDYEQTGYEPLDKYVGGLPVSSMTLVIGPPGTGKTYWSLKVASCYAKRRKKVIIFSLEMTSRQLTRRAMRLMKIPKAVADYIYIVEDILSPGDISSLSGRIGDACLIIVDFAELMMVGERSEAAMGEAYWTLTTMAKTLGVPVVVLGQQNRSSLADLIPTMGAARYTGMADILAALEIGLHTRQKVLRKVDMNGDQNAILPLQPGNGAQVVIKARYGTEQKEIGAVEVPFSNEKGWGDKATRWHSLG